MNYSNHLKSLNAKTLFYTFLLFIFIGIPFLSFDYGSSADEGLDIGHSESVIKYYLEGDSSAIYQPVSGFHNYGLSPQIVTHIVAKAFSVDDIYTFRHFICSLFFCMMIFYTMLLGKQLGGYIVGLFSGIFLVLSPALFNHGMNNLKDTPFALAYIMCIYYIVKISGKGPEFKKQDMLGLAVGLVLAIGNRIGGVMLFGYIAFIFLVKMVVENGYKKIFNKRYLKFYLLIIGVLILSYGLSLLLWPYALQDPIKNPITALKVFSNYSVGIFQLFEGKYTLSTFLPRYYLIKYIFITTPVIILVGFLLFLLLYLKQLLFLRNYIWIFLLFSVVFPLVFIAYQKSNVYGGWRHVIFIYPVMVVLSCTGFSTLYNYFKKKIPASVYYSGLVLFLFHPIRHYMVNHPYQYIYFNEIIGGVKGAYGNYEMDYYFNSGKKAAFWMGDSLKMIGNKLNPVKIMVNHGSVCNYLAKMDNIKCNYVRFYERATVDWDYYIAVNANVHPFQLKNGIWPPKGTIHTLRVDNVPICVIIKRNNKDDLLASQAIASGKAREAIEHLNSFLRYDSRSEWAWFQLAYIYAQNNLMAESQKYLNECFKYHPEYLPGRFLQGLIYYNTNRLIDSQRFFANLIRDKFDLKSSYKWSGMIYEKEKNYRKALDQYGYAMGAGNTEKDLYKKIANCLRLLGEVNQAAKYESMAQ